MITEVKFEPAATSGDWIDVEDSSGSIVDSSEPLPDGECDPLLDEGCCEGGSETLESGLGDDGGSCEEEMNYVEMNSLSTSSTGDGPDDNCDDEFQKTVTELGSSYVAFEVSAVLFAAPEPTGVTKAIGTATFAGGVVQGARGLISAGFFFACHLLEE